MIMLLTICILVLLAGNLKLAQKHLFLDRDGTLICEEHYLCDPAKVVLERNVVKGLRRFVHAGYRLVVVSNQSGVGRGLITEEDVLAVNTRVRQLLVYDQISISSWHYCIHSPSDQCACRKPAPGLFQQAAALYPVDWQSSVMVGDKPSDVRAGLTMGMRSYLVTTGYGLHHSDWAQSNNIQVVSCLCNLAELIL